MTEVVSVRFRNNAKSYDFDPQGLRIEAGEQVIVETAQGVEFVRCVMGNHEVPDQTVVQPLRPVVRLATAADCRTAARNREREKEAFAVCEERIVARGLEMRLTDVECSFDGKKLLFFFTADCRVDFRELVKDLAAVFHARIELRQIGVRDEAKMIGGLGICGRPLCCGQFLEDFVSVSIKMAKTQNLSLNPAKISGTCGRLMCCLKYEQNAYEDAAHRLPKPDSFVDTPDGVGNVCGVDLLREEVQVRLDNGEGGPKKYKGEEVRVLRSGKGSREGIEIPEKRPERVGENEEQAEKGRGTIGKRPAWENQRDRRSDKPTRVEPSVKVDNQPKQERKTENPPKQERAVRQDNRFKTENRSKTENRNQFEHRPRVEQPVRQENQPKQERPVRQKPSMQGAKHTEVRQPTVEASVKETRQEKPVRDTVSKETRQERPTREFSPRENRQSRRGQRQQNWQEKRPNETETERLPVRSKRDTTAEMKAAADRAAQRGNGQENKDSQPKDSKNGQPREGKRGQYHRRPHHFQRKKNSGEGGTSQT